MNSIYQNVDRSPVTTGLLKDYGLNLTDVSRYNGTIQPNNAVNRGEWQSLYSSLYFMKFNPNATLPSPASLNTAIANNRSVINGTVVNDLLALHFNYEQFKSNAISGNLVYVSNNKIYDVPGRTASPYEIKTAFAFSSVNSYLTGNDHIFRFSSQLFFKNVSKTISIVQVDFGDGLGYRSVAMGSNQYVTYGSDGEKTLLLRITFTDGLILHGKSLVKVKGTSNICQSCRYDDNPDFLSFPQSDFPVPQVQIGSGNVWIYYGGNDRILDKPLILAEGFDPFNDIGREILFLEDFLGRTVNIDYQGQMLRQALDEHNYDLVFVDYGWGGDAIQRNAFMLENVIQWVNQQKAMNGSTEKNIVAGVSMGGLVARYALRDMEIRNQNNPSSPQHDTRLYVSFDSPHLGANVPLGFQAAIRYLAGLSIMFVDVIDTAPELREGLNALNSPAARQMLYYQLNNTGDGTVINNAPHAAFMSEFNAMGMPQRWGIRNIAIASGSECGIDQGYAPLPGGGGGGPGPIECEYPPCQVPESNSVLPNPAKDRVTVNIEKEPGDNRVSKITIFNSMQTSLISISTTERKAEIPVSSLTQGLYYIRVETGNKVTTSQLVIED